jgi:hypothetical protein
LPYQRQQFMLKAADQLGGYLNLYFLFPNCHPNAANRQRRRFSPALEPMEAPAGN